MASLSYEQGPPLSAPLRLFLAAPLFLMLAASAGIVVAADWTGGRLTAAALALTHLLTLGYLGTVMQGALLQMLPVVLGAPVPRAEWVSRCGLYGLVSGSLLLAAGLFQGEPFMLTAAMAALAVAWLPFLAGLGLALARALSGGDMDWPLRLSGLALLATVVSGFALAGGLAGWWPLPDLAVWLNLHAGWGLFGWVAVLIVGVAYQVVPMLQLTPAYPRRLSRTMAWLLPLGVAAYSLDQLAGWPFRGGAWLAGASGLAFGMATLSLLRRRRRRLADVTLDFWRLGMVSLAGSSGLFILLDALPAAWQDKAELSLGLLFLLGFAAAVVNGMLYKILPFLAWFHLQSQTGARAGSIPNLREMIAEPAMRRHFRLHLGAVCLLVPAPWLPSGAALPGLLLLLASGQVLWLNLLAARRAFLAHGGRLG